MSAFFCFIGNSWFFIFSSTIRQLCVNICRMFFNKSYTDAKLTSVRWVSLGLGQGQGQGLEKGKSLRTSNTPTPTTKFIYLF